MTTLHILSSGQLPLWQMINDSDWVWVQTERLLPLVPQLQQYQILGNHQIETIAEIISEEVDKVVNW